MSREIDIKDSDSAPENMHLLVIYHDSEVVVDVDFEGSVTYGEGYSPDDAAAHFWEKIADFDDFERAAGMKGNGYELLPLDPEERAAWAQENGLELVEVEE